MRGSIQIRNVLNALGVYRTEKPFLNAEVSAYEAGITMILEETERLLQDAFAATAGEEGLHRRESLFRSWQAPGSAEDLRRQIAEREKIRSCLIGELEQRLAACGIEGKIEENYRNGILIRAKSCSGPQGEQALQEAKQLMPLHLPCFLAVGEEIFS